MRLSMRQTSQHICQAVKSRTHCPAHAYIHTPETKNNPCRISALSPRAGRRFDSVFVLLVRRRRDPHHSTWERSRDSNHKDLDRYCVEKCLDEKKKKINVSSGGTDFQPVELCTWVCFWSLGCCRFNHDEELVDEMPKREGQLRNI